MPSEVEFIQSTLTEYREALAALPPQFQVLSRQCDRQIDLLCEEAGIMGDIQGLRDNLTTNQKKIQTQADFLQGQIAALTLVFDTYHFAPIPEGVTHLYGIELEPLEGETRLRVMHGNMPGQEEVPGWRETILSLGGDPDFRDWDGTYEDEDEDDIVQYEEDPFIDDLIVGVTDTDTVAEEEEDDIVHTLFAPKTDPLDDILEEETPSTTSSIAKIADEISRIEEKLEEGVASDDDLLRVNELTSQLQDVLGE